MKLEVVSFFIILTEIISVYGRQRKFVIESKKTGKVIEVSESGHEVLEWDNTDKQLWTLESKRNGYKIRNVANEDYIIRCNIDDTAYTKWKLSTEGDTRIEVEDPNIYVCEDETSLKCCRSKTDDESDVWKFIEQSKKINMTFAIENKKTGEVLEERDATLEMGPWKNRNTQLWTLKPQKHESGYSIVNVESGSVLTYSKNGTDNEVLKLNPREDTRIEVAHLNAFLTNKNGKPIFLGYKQNDDSDKWRFIQEDSMENNTQKKRIYVEDYQEKFVIENKKTRKVLGMLQRYIVLEEWKDKNLQLWTLEPQNKSGYFVIRNIEDRGVLTFNKNGTDCQTWKINTQGETWIQLEDANVFLADTDGAITFVENKQGDDSDIWLLVEQTSKRASMKFNPIYIETQLLNDIVPS